MRSFFGKFGSAGDAGECIQAVNDVFSALDDYHKKFVFISADEIYLTCDFLVELLSLVVKIIHDAGGFVFGAVTDNLSVNQKSFKTIHERYTSDAIHSVEHPIPNDHFPSFLMMYDTSHLMKNLRNNWITEKMAHLNLRILIQIRNCLRDGVI